MTETPEEYRQRVEQIDSKFFDDFGKRGSPHAQQSFEYEKLAVDYSHKGFQTLAYLNGGALVAIPTAMAFFKADVSKADILITAGLFVLGLLFVVFAEGTAFFTMTTRSEAHAFFLWEQFQRVAALQFHQGSAPKAERSNAAAEQRNLASKRLGRSNVYRWAGIICFALSLVGFIAGCIWGAVTVMAAKQLTSS